MYLVPRYKSPADLAALKSGEERLKWLFTRRLYTQEGLSRALEDLGKINRQGGDFQMENEFGDKKKVEYTDPIKRPGPPEQKAKILVYRSYHHHAYPNLARIEGVTIDPGFEDCAFGPANAPMNPAEESPDLCCEFAGKEETFQISQRKLDEVQVLQRSCCPLAKKC